MYISSLQHQLTYQQYIDLQVRYRKETQYRDYTTATTDMNIMTIKWK